MESNWRFGVWDAGFWGQGIRLDSPRSVLLPPMFRDQCYEQDYARLTAYILRPDGSVDSIQEVWFPALGLRAPYMQPWFPD